MKNKLSEEEYNLTYAALKLIENLFKQGKIKKHVFKNILNDYKDCTFVNDVRLKNQKIIEWRGC